ncbi:MAG: carbamoyl phosphate synthase small subunit [Bacteriovoracaceae bacterium]|nr:carbamoyl phosphate synthase small subunit [Bacteriovoracaceae bacterium]
MAKLILENGVVFEGTSFGAEISCVGEVVFNTGMTGYQEILTDPSYCGQMVCMTYPLIGNYGINAQDFESLKPALNAFIVREYCEIPSHFRSQMSLNDYLKKMNIPGLAGIDTRKLTKILRGFGTMKGMLLNENISAQDEEKLQALFKKPLPTNEVEQVSTKTAFSCPGNGPRVVLVDFGYKQGILKGLTDLGFQVTVVPHNITAQEIYAYNPQGVVLSNGPGDPLSLSHALSMIQEVQTKLPLMGICMGHQVFALANGAKTQKMKFGHRGCNHPVKDLVSGKVYLTSQNHGYEVDEKSLKQTSLQVTHINVNDGCIEGIRHKKYPAFSVQYHPEAAPGPQDNAYLFQEFSKLIAEHHRGQNA